MLPDLNKIAAELAALWPWEAIAVVLAIAYLVLAIRESVWCWPAGLGSTLIYLALFFRSRLYAECVLQLFYVGVSVYGWWHWATGAKAPPTAAVAASVGAASAATPNGAPENGEVGAASAAIPIITWSASRHAAALAGIAALAALSGTLLKAYTPAAFPYLDSLTAWGSVVTTWMVARKVLENWHYWFVIDSLSVYIYMRRGLWLTVGLFLLYLVLIVIGYRAWCGHLRRQGDAASQ